MRNKSVNQVCHRKVLKKIKRNLGNQLFIAAMIGISASSSLRLWPITVFPCKSGTPCSEISPSPHQIITLLFSLTVLNKENLILLPINLKPFKLQLKPNQ